MNKWMIFTTVLFSALTAIASPVINADENGAAIHGYDPVSYFKDKSPQKGKKEISAQSDGATYFFSSETNKTEFLKDPKKYAPQFGGWCAYAVANKKKADVDPESYVIQDGRLLLFYKGVLNNTREKWLSTKDKTPATFLKDADANWPTVKNKE